MMPSNKWTILITVTVVAFITNVDSTIVVVGLPNMMEGLHITLVSGLWTMTAYIITSTVFLLPGGRWSDMIGTKRIFLIGLIVFTVSTALCGAAGSGATLIGYRFVQGAGAALALATGVPIIMSTFPRQELGRALGINATSWVLGAIVGPVAGGALINLFGWRSMFFVTVPFAIMGIGVSARVLRETPRQTTSTMDWPGVLWFGGGLVALLIALSEGRAWGWSSARFVGCAAAAVIFLGLFVATELRVTQPLFSLKMLTNRAFAIGLGVTLTYSIGYYATTFLLTLYLQGALHLNPLDAGLMLVPLAAPQLVVGPLGGLFADRFGPLRLIFLGLFLLAIGDLILGFVGRQLSLVAMVGPQVMMSVASGLSWPALQKATLSGVSNDQTGVASGMFYTVRNVGMALSLTLAFVVAALTIPPAVASEAFLGTADLLNRSVVTALVRSTDMGFRLFMGFFVASMALTLCFLGLFHRQHTTGIQEDSAVE